MDNIIGKGVVYTGKGELALYDKWLTEDGAKPIGSVTAGNPVGVVTDEKTDTGDIQIRNNAGGFVYTVYDPSIMKVTDNDPGQDISTDTAWFASTQNGTDTFTFTNVLSSSLPTMTSAQATVTPAVRPIVDGLKKKPVPWVYVLVAGVLLIATAALVIHALKKKAQQPVTVPVA